MNGEFVLYTGYGYWSPLIWLTGFVVAALIAYLIWRLGESGYNKGEQACAPFLSGNAEPDAEKVHIRGGNLYWGFTEGLSGYYNYIKPLHTGNLADYMLWYLGVTAAMLVLMVVLL